MPLYDYACEECGHEFEEIAGAEDAAPACPKCSSEKTTRLMSATHIKGNPNPLGKYDSVKMMHPANRPAAVRGGGCSSGG